MYAFVELGTLVALCGLARLVNTPRRSWPGAVAIFGGTVLACGSHYMGSFVAPTVVAIAIAARLGHRVSRNRAALAIGAAAAGCIAWVPWLVTIVPIQLQANWGYQARTDLRSLVELPIRHLLVEMDVVPPAWRFLGFALGAILLSGIVLHLVLLARTRKPQLLWVLLGLVVPVVTAFALMIVAPPNFAPKYLMTSSPGSVLVIAAGLGSIPWPRSRRIVGIAAVAGCLSVTLLHRMGNAREDFRSACAELVQEWEVGDRVFTVSGTYEGYSQSTVRHYLRGQPEIVAAILDLSEYEDRLPDALPAGARVHVIYRDAYYAWPHMAKVKRGLRLVREGPRRFRVQYLLFEVPQ